MPTPNARTSPHAGRRTALLVLLALLVVGFVGLYAFLTGRVYSISGRRAIPGGPVQGLVTHTFLGVIPLGTTELPGLTAARLEVVPDKKNAAKPTFRVLFDTDAGPVPMTGYSQGGRQAHAELVAEINARLADAQSDAFQVRHVAAGGFILFPVLVVLLVMTYPLLRFAAAKRFSDSAVGKHGSA